MALTPKKVYAILKKYTDNSIAGGGAVRGKNCVITSITAITGGHRITFQWTLDNGTVQTDTMDVMDGAKGADGANGAPGADGKDGLTPTIAISSITGGHRVTVTIGTSSDVFDVMDGVDGKDGVGVPNGGTTGQVLKKKSSTDYDTEWADESGGGTEHGIPSGGTSGQILSKNSNTDYDVKWVDPESSSQIQSDWGQTDTTKVDFIKNKPQNLVQDANYVHTDNNYSDAEQSIVAGISAALNTKVDKETGKSLMSDAEHTKLASINADAEENVLEGVQVNGTDLPIDANKKVNIDLSGKADKVANATNGNFAVLDSTGNLVDSLKSPSSYYTKTEIDNIVDAIKNGRFEFVSVLPTTDIKTNVIYLVPSSDPQTENVKDEYINLDGTTTGWELIGSTNIDLSNYIQKSTTAGLVKNDGSIDTNTYLTASDISGKQNTITISGKKVLI